MNPVLAIIILILVIVNIAFSFSKRPLYSNLYLFFSTVLFIVGGIGTIIVRNDLLRDFDVAKYILNLAICEWLLLYLPLIVKRIIRNNAMHPPYHQES